MRKLSIQSNDVVYSVRLPAEVAEEIEDLRARKLWSRSEFLKAAIGVYMLEVRDDD